MDAITKLRQRDTVKNIEKSKELLESVRLSLKGRPSKPVHLFKINQQIKKMHLDSQQEPNPNEETSKINSILAYFDQDRQQFQLLQAYINAYQQKLNITGTTQSFVTKSRKSLNEKKEECENEKDLAITFEELAEQQQIYEGDINIDYDEFTKVRHDQKLRNA